MKQTTPTPPNAKPAPIVQPPPLLTEFHINQLLAQLTKHFTPQVNSWHDQSHGPVRNWTIEFICQTLDKENIYNNTMPSFVPEKLGLLAGYIEKYIYQNAKNVMDYCDMKILRLKILTIINIFNRQVYLVNAKLDPENAMFLPGAEGEAPALPPTTSSSQPNNPPLINEALPMSTASTIQNTHNTSTNASTTISSNHPAIVAANSASTTSNPTHQSSGVINLPANLMNMPQSSDQYPDDDTSSDIGPFSDEEDDENPNDSLLKPQNTVENSNKMQVVEPDVQGDIQEDNSELNNDMGNDDDMDEENNEDNNDDMNNYDDDMGPDDDVNDDDSQDIGDEDDEENNDNEDINNTMNTTMNTTMDTSLNTTMNTTLNNTLDEDNVNNIDDNQDGEDNQVANEISNKIADDEANKVANEVVNNQPAQGSNPDAEPKQHPNAVIDLVEEMTSQPITEPASGASATKQRETGFSRLFIIKVLMCAEVDLRFQQCNNFLVQPELIKQWLLKAKHQCSDMDITEDERTLGGPLYDGNNHMTYWTDANQFIAWWKIYIDNPTRFIDLQNASKYDGKEHHLLQRAHWCRLIIELTTLIKSYCTRSMATNPSQYLLEAPNNPINYQRPFPIHLFDLIESNLLSDYVYWGEYGNHILITDCFAFYDRLLLEYFPDFTPQIFQNTLHAYGFAINIMNNTQMIFHPKFMHGHKHLVSQIVLINSNDPSERVGIHTMPIPSIVNNTRQYLIPSNMSADMLFANVANPKPPTVQTLPSIPSQNNPQQSPSSILPRSSGETNTNSILSSIPVVTTGSSAQAIIPRINYRNAPQLQSLLTSTTTSIVLPTNPMLQNPSMLTSINNMNQVNRSSYAPTMPINPMTTTNMLSNTNNNMNTNNNNRSQYINNNNGNIPRRTYNKSNKNQSPTVLAAMYSSTNNNNTDELPNPLETISSQFSTIQENNAENNQHEIRKKTQNNNINNIINMNNNMNNNNLNTQMMLANKKIEISNSNTPSQTSFRVMKPFHRFLKEAYETEKRGGNSNSNNAQGVDGQNETVSSPPPRFSSGNYSNISTMEDYDELPPSSTSNNDNSARLSRMGKDPSTDLPVLSTNDTSSSIGVTPKVPSSPASQASRSMEVANSVLPTNQHPHMLAANYDQMSETNSIPPQNMIEKAFNPNIRTRGKKFQNSSADIIEMTPPLIPTATTSTATNKTKDILKEKTDNKDHSSSRIGKDYQAKLPTKLTGSVIRTNLDKNTTSSTSENAWNPKTFGINNSIDLYDTHFNTEKYLEHGVLIAKEQIRRLVYQLLRPGSFVVVYLSGTKQYYPYSKEILFNPNYSTSFPNDSQMSNSPYRLVIILQTIPIANEERYPRKRTHSAIESSTQANTTHSSSSSLSSEASNEAIHHYYLVYDGVASFLVEKSQIQINQFFQEDDFLTLFTQQQYQLSATLTLYLTQLENKLSKGFFFPDWKSDEVKALCAGFKKYGKNLEKVYQVTTLKNTKDWKSVVDFFLTNLHYIDHGRHKQFIKLFERVEDMEHRAQQLLRQQEENGGVVDLGKPPRNMNKIRGRPSLSRKESSSLDSLADLQDKMEVESENVQLNDDEEEDMNDDENAEENENNNDDDDEEQSDLVSIDGGDDRNETITQENTIPAEEPTINKINEPTGSSATVSDSPKITPSEPVDLINDNPRAMETEETTINKTNDDNNDNDVDDNESLQGKQIKEETLKAISERMEEAEVEAAEVAVEQVEEQEESKKEVVEQAEDHDEESDDGDDEEDDSDEDDEEDLKDKSDEGNNTNPSAKSLKRRRRRRASNPQLFLSKYRKSKKKPEGFKVFYIFQDALNRKRRKYNPMGSLEVTAKGRDNNLFISPRKRIPRKNLPNHPFFDHFYPHLIGSTKTDGGNVIETKKVNVPETKPPSSTTSVTAITTTSSTSNKKDQALKQKTPEPSNKSDHKQDNKNDNKHENKTENKKTNVTIGTRNSRTSSRPPALSTRRASGTTSSLDLPPLRRRSL